MDGGRLRAGSVADIGFEKRLVVRDGAALAHEKRVADPTALDRHFYPSRRKNNRCILGDSGSVVGTGRESGLWSVERVAQGDEREARMGS